MTGSPAWAKRAGMLSLTRHVCACNNAVLPGRRLPFLLGSEPVGWVLPGTADAAARGGARSTPGGLVLDDPAALPALARGLADDGHFLWRDEAFDVRTEPGRPVLTQIDRGALPLFGLIAEGVHVNGLVERADGLHVWLARRATDRPLDPGKLDHLAAGGIQAGLGPAETVVKEAQEEAGLPRALAETAQFRGLIRYTMERPEGLRRDVLHCYDLMLPASFEPRAMDGEVAGFELWPIRRVLATVRDTDDFKFNVNLVLINLFERLSLVA